MKKILVLLSLFALASGAWATEIPSGWGGYSWDVVIQHVEYGAGGLPTDLQLYLIDKNILDSGNITGHKVYMTAALAEASAKEYNDHVKDGYQVTYANVDVNPQTLNPKSKTEKYVKTYVAFKSETDLASLYLNSHDFDKGPMRVDDLVGVIFSASTGRYQTLTVNASNTSTFGSEAVFNPVPEPTSGLLLLLGVAGLALRRKKAA